MDINLSMKEYWQSYQCNLDYSSNIITISITSNYLHNYYYTKDIKLVIYIFSHQNISKAITFMEPEQSPTNYRPIKTSIPGLTLVPSFITLQQEKYLIQCIKQQQWNNSLKRRTQHYGYEYSYDRKSIAKPTQPIPEWCIPIKARLQKLLNQKTSEQQKIIFDQMIINEYEPGQGISPHIDNINLFKDIIVSLSLSSDCIMIFQKVVKDKKRENLQQPPQERNSHSKQQIQLKRRSLTIMQKQSRYDWKHSIPARKKDNGNQRLVRYSLTFRKMKI